MCKTVLQTCHCQFDVSAYRGKDHRYPLELNIGPTIAGNQKTGWLYLQTDTLRRLGVILTFSGDSPWLLRLVMGKSNEKANMYPSRLPMYIPDGNTNFLPTTRDKGSGMRTMVKIPYRQGIPEQSLVSMDDVRCICPDPLHMTTRSTERDLKNIAQKIVQDKWPNESVAMQNFELNLSSRQATNKPSYHFDRTKPSSTAAGHVSKVSLSGSGALTIIAEVSQLETASNEIKGLFDNVWKDEIVSGTNSTNTEFLIDDDMFANSVMVLKSHTYSKHLFNKTNPLEEEPKEAKYISTYDACELLRRSLNRCVFLLRDSKDGLDVVEYSKWAEIYYQTSLLLFGEKGLTPYKLKLVMFPSLIEGGKIISPWWHICEGLEKSNHHAHKDFQSKTMRGGGFTHNQDPLFLELFFSYCKMLKLATRTDKITELSEIQSKACEAVLNVRLDQLPFEIWTDICRKPITLPKIDVGIERSLGSRLMGQRFHVVGLYTGTEAATSGKEHEPLPKKPHQMVEHWINELGGEVVSKKALETVFYQLSKTPNFFIVLKDEDDLTMGTTPTVMATTENTTESSATDGTTPTDDPTGNLTTDHGSDTSTQLNASTASPQRKKRKTKPKAPKAPKAPKPPTKLTVAAKFCREFAGGDLKFVNLSYITNSLTSTKVLDPFSEKYMLLPGPLVKKVHVSDIRPLLIQQTRESNEKCISTTSALKKHTKIARKRRSEDADVIKFRLKNAENVALAEEEARNRSLAEDEERLKNAENVALAEEEARNPPLAEDEEADDEGNSDDSEEDFWRIC